MKKRILFFPIALILCLGAYIVISDDDVSQQKQLQSQSYAKTQQSISDDKKLPAENDDEFLPFTENTNDNTASVNASNPINNKNNATAERKLRSQDRKRIRECDEGRQRNGNGNRNCNEKNKGRRNCIK